MLSNLRCHSKSEWERTSLPPMMMDQSRASFSKRRCALLYGSRPPCVMLATMRARQGLQRRRKAQRARHIAHQAQRAACRSGRHC